MRVPSSGLYIDNPAFPLLQAQITYWNITSGAGNVLGTTLVDANLANEPNYAGLLIKILDGGAAGQVRTIATHIGGTITVAAAWTNAAGAVQQIAAATRFVILSAVGGGGGPPPAPPAPGVGLWMFGVCAPGMAASLDTLVLTNLAGFNNDLFNNEFWVQVIHNASAPGAAPEREIRRILDYVGATGTFTTDAFSVNVEANDLVCVFHESIMAIEILGFGTLTVSNANTPRDGARAEGDDYFNGCLLMTTEGVVRFQPRRIVDYDGTGAPGTFTLDPNNPFTAAPGLVDYIIIGDQTEFVPAADGINNRTPSDVIGQKGDSALYALAATASLMRYLKANHQVKIEATGEADAGSDTNTLVDAARAEAIDYWNGLTLLMISGNNAGLSRPIVYYTVGSIEVRPAFPNAIAATDIYVILSNYHEVVPTADSTENYQPRDVIGNKADAATLDNMSALATASLVAEVKRVLLRMAPNAFGATVNGNVDTALDDMIAHLAAYFVALGAAWSVTVNPGGGAKTDLVSTLSSIADMLAGDTGIVTYPAAANIGNGVSMAEALRAILTSLVAGDDYDAYTAINNVARASVNAAFQGIASVLGADGANVFNPTIQGAAQTDLDAALYQFALYFNALGAALSITMNPGAGARANLQLILQDLGDMLAGATGIVTFPAAAVPGNGVSIAEVLRQIYNDVIALTGAGILHEQADVPFNVNAALAEANIFNLAAANTRYVVRSLRLKCVDPGVETVTVRLYELVNDVQTLVDTFAITTANFATAHSLADMFGLFQLAGDNLKVTVIATAAGPYVCTGNYCTATATI